MISRYRDPPLCRLLYSPDGARLGSWSDIKGVSPIYGAFAVFGQKIG